MKVDLAGKRARISGEANAVTEAIAAALAENGAVLDDGGQPDIAIFALPLLPGTGVDIEPLLAEMQQAAVAMSERGGRILLIASAIALMPMRRHPEFSRQVAGATAAKRRGRRPSETVRPKACPPKPWRRGTTASHTLSIPFFKT